MLLLWLTTGGQAALMVGYRGTWLLLATEELAALMADYKKTCL